jgi:hypothetical protein
MYVYTLARTLNYTDIFNMANTPEVIRWKVGERSGVVVELEVEYKLVRLLRCKGVEIDGIVVVEVSRDLLDC